MRLPGATYAISDTGPLISCFQSDSFHLFAQIFTEIHLPPVCLKELQEHGWGEYVKTAMPRLVIIDLMPYEEQQADIVAERIANHMDSHDPVAETHLGEAQAIILALREEYQNDLLLMDELAARAIAKEEGIKLSGFPGVLLMATQTAIISAEDMRKRLELCQAQGTHYSSKFIQQVYKMGKRNRRKL